MRFIPQVVSNKAAGRLASVNKNAPGLLLTGGILGMVGTVVLSSRATLKVEGILDQVASDGDRADAAVALKPEEYTAEDAKKDKLIALGHGTRAIIKLYAPSVALGTISVLALTKSHSIQSERLAGVTAAYAAIDKGYREYRERVRDRFGSDVDEELRFPTEKLRLKNDATGKMETITRIDEDAIREAGYSEYYTFFDERSSSWDPNPDYRFAFLTSQQAYFNTILQQRGHVFLNEVFDKLGLPHTPAGAVVGWRVGSDGDGYIDFSIFDDTMAKRDFRVGREDTVLLDFNVDGVIWDKI